MRIALTALLLAACEVNVTVPPAEAKGPATELVQVDEAGKQAPILSYPTPEECAKTARNMTAGAKESGSRGSFTCVAVQTSTR